MARISLDTSVFSINGSINATTIQQSIGGFQARTKPRPSRDITQYQFNQYPNMSKWLQAWKALTLAQQTQWQIYASTYTFIDKWSRPKIIRAVNWFVSINSNLELVGSAPVSIPPAYTYPLSVPGFTVNLTPTSMLIQPDFPASRPNQKFIINASGPVSRTSQITNRNTLQVGVYDTIPISDFNCESAYSASRGFNYADIASTGHFCVVVWISSIHTISGLCYPPVKRVGCLGGCEDQGIGQMAIGECFIVR